MPPLTPSPWNQQLKSPWDQQQMPLPLQQNESSESEPIVGWSLKR